MSPRDVVAELRAARVEAPPELRERVRLVAAAAPAEPRTPLFRRRRSWLVAAVPVAAALAAAGVVLTRPSQPGSPQVAVHGEALRAQAPRALARPGRAAGAATVPASPSRVQRYGASLSLRVPSAARVSDAVQRALRIAGSLSGYASSVHVDTSGGRGSAELVLRIPRANIREAIARLAQLGTITGEHVDVQDIQSGLNATDRTIARLQRQLAALRARQQTDAVQRRIAALTTRVVRLQRSRASTVRSAHFATVQVSLATPAPKHAQKQHGHGPLHGLGVALRWIGIGLVYALALGVPALLVALLVWLAVRALRRRREDALLARS